MWFLIKAAFWFALVLVLLPLTNPESEARLDSQPQVHVGQTVAAATSAIGDLSGLCTRQPDVCRTGGEAISALGARARDGALIAYQFLDNRFGDGHGAVTTGSLAPALPTASAPADTSERALPSIPVPMPAPRRAASAAVQATAQAEPAFLPKPYSPPID